MSNTATAYEVGHLYEVDPGSAEDRREHPPNSTGWPRSSPTSKNASSKPRSVAGPGRSPS
jgi:hypothetical protein